MKFNSVKCKVVEIRYSEVRPSYDYHLTGGQLQGSSSEGSTGADVLPTLSPENHIRFVKEMNDIRVNIKIAFKHIDEMIFRKYIQYTRDPK